MKGSLRVMNRAVMAAARQGTVTCGEPDRTERIRGVARGVRVMAVLRPARSIIFGSEEPGNAIRNIRSKCQGILLM